MSPLFEENSNFNESLEKFSLLTTDLITLALEEKKKLKELHDACSETNVNINHIISLLTPFNLNSLDRNNRSLLHKAVKNENYNLVRILLEYGAFINTVDIWNKTPLITAIESNFTQIASLLISYLNTNYSKFSIEKLEETTSLVYRTYFDSMNQIYLFLNSLNNEPAPLRCITYFTRTKIPLHIAVTNSNFEITYCLLKNGTDPNERDYLGLTALHRAAALRNLNIVKLLIKFRADPNLKSNRRILPLHWSCRWSDVHTIEYLIEKTAKYNLNQLDDLKFTPLDRLWSRLNSFKYKTLDDKLDFDFMIRKLHVAFKKAIKFGCLLKMYKFDPFKVYQNYYLIPNLLMLFEALFTLKRPSLDYCRSQQAIQLFTVNVMKLLIEKLTIKYSNLIKEKLETQNESNSLHESEFNDLVSEVARLKKLILLILTSGQFLYEFNFSFTTYHMYSVNREFLSDLFSHIFEIADLEIRDVFNLDLVYKLNQTYCLRQLFHTFLYNYSHECLKSPFRLQELARIKIRNTLKVLNETTINNQLDLTRVTRDYLFFN